MRCTFYLPYESYDFNGFDYDNSYYSSESYTDALNNSLEESKNAVFMLQSGIKTNRLLNNDTKYSNIEPNHLNNDKEISLSSCEVRIFNEMNNPETIDSIINYNLSNDVFILIVNFDFNTIEEEFEEELKNWIEMSNRISSSKQDDEWIFMNLPQLTFKFKCLNRYGSDTYGELLNCKIVQKMNHNSYAILVEKLNFLKVL